MYAAQGTSMLHTGSQKLSDIGETYDNDYARFKKFRQIHIS